MRGDGGKDYCEWGEGANILWLVLRFGAGIMAIHVVTVAGGMGACTRSPGVRAVTNVVIDRRINVAFDNKKRYTGINSRWLPQGLPIYNIR